MEDKTKHTDADNEADEASASPESAAELAAAEAEAALKAAEAVPEEEPAAEEPVAEATDEKPAEKADEKKPAEEAKPAAIDWKDRYARAMADFDNFRKRTERDRDDLAKFAAQGVIKDVLGTVDNLARALDGAKERADDPFVKGVRLVYDGLLKTLADHGATPLDAVGEPFDANYHEALAKMPSETVAEDIVMNEVQRGWLLHGKLLRVAKVVVSAGKGA